MVYDLNWYHSTELHNFELNRYAQNKNSQYCSLLQALRLNRYDGEAKCI